MTTKTCRKCCVTHPATREFFKPHNGCRDGVDSWCRSCSRIYLRAYKEKFGQRLNEKRRKRYREINGPLVIAKKKENQRLVPYLVRAQNLRSGLLTRSKRDGCPKDTCVFTTKILIARLIEPGTCECCGVKLRIVFEDGDQVGAKSDRSPSLDRFDPSKGYTRENVALLCWRCNNLKRDATSAELRRIADWMDNRKPSFL